MAQNERQRSSAEVVLPAPDLDDSIGFFRDRLGLRLEMIFPADAPRVAVMAGRGVRLRLDSTATAGDLKIRIEVGAEERERLGVSLEGPGGIAVEVAAADDEVVVPPLVPERIVLDAVEASSWSTGRAGMQYRDLVPGRLGGAVIASHIRIPDGGPVPDYVHHHHVRFQLIYCLRGWTRLVYEDQGPPFVMRAGDCVLQPPHIRHRVLECSDRFEVVEVGCPAEHQTLVDHELQLPTGRSGPGRDFGGQRFAFHRAEDTPWVSGDEVDVRDTGLHAASGGAVAVRTCRIPGGGDYSFTPSSAFYLAFVLAGSCRLLAGGKPVEIGTDASFVIPAGTECRLESPSPDLRWLEVEAAI